MKYTLFAIFATAMAVSAQAQTINISRPAYPSEALNFVPDAVTSRTDREAVSEFLKAKSRARAAFEERVSEACPALLAGAMTPEEFAARLDSEVDQMNSEIYAAYERMTTDISSFAVSAIEAQTWSAVSADTLAVDVVAVSPVMAELSFRQKCGST